MTSRRQFFLGSTLLFMGVRGAPAGWAATGFAVTHSDAEWHRRLTPLQFAVLREAATERPWSSPLLGEHRAGHFGCAGCRILAFDAQTKFDSGTGWPSFYRPMPHAVRERTDRSLGMERTEVLCATCGGHLGHVFNDGPAPTGLRYCLNGAALMFQPA